MKYLRNIIVFILCLFGGCNATFAQVITPDSTLATGTTSLPNGLQWRYKNVNGKLTYYVYNSANGKFSLMYTGQQLNGATITINGVSYPILSNPNFSVGGTYTAGFGLSLLGTVFKVDSTKVPTQYQLGQSLALKQNTSGRGAANGYAPLDANSHVPLANLGYNSAQAYSYLGTDGIFHQINLAGGSNSEVYGYLSVPNGGSGTGSNTGALFWGAGGTLGSAAYTPASAYGTSAQQSANTTAIGLKQPRIIGNKPAATGTSYSATDSVTQVAANLNSAIIANTAKLGTKLDSLINKPLINKINGKQDSVHNAALLLAKEDKSNKKDVNDSTSTNYFTTGQTKRLLATASPNLTASGGIVKTGNNLTADTAYLRTAANSLTLAQAQTKTLAERTAVAVLTHKDLTDATNTFPTFNQNTTGNAASATKLQTARNINGVPFDGTANITIPGSSTNFAIRETPSGLVNTSNTTYTLAHTPI